MEDESGNISETRKNEEKLPWMAYRKLTNALSNGTISDPLLLPLLQFWGFATPTQKSNRYYLRNG